MAMWVLLVLLLLPAQIPTANAVIPDQRWPSTGAPEPHEEIWNKLTDASLGQQSGCQSIGEPLALSNAADFPAHCVSRAGALTADTFDVEADNSTCYFKHCSDTGLSFQTGSPGRSTYSLLLAPWYQIYKGGYSVKDDCEARGERVPDAGASLPYFCYWWAAVLGADTVNVKQDGSKCIFWKCSAFSDIEIDDEGDNDLDTFTTLGSNFHHIVRKEDGVITNCRSAGSSLTLSSPPTTDPPIECVSKAVELRADTFDITPTGCSFTRCESLDGLTFSANSPGADVYTILSGKWNQITLAEDNRTVKCEDVGSPLDIADPADFPQACYSKAMILGSDTFDAEADGSRCHFKKCFIFGNIIFDEGQPGKTTHTILSGSWSRMVMKQEGLSPDCLYRGRHYFPTSIQVCLSKAVLLGANVVDYRDSPANCNFKLCSSKYLDVSMTDSFGNVTVYTLLFPRVGTEWGYCDPTNCLDFHLLYTSKVLGRFLPMKRGVECDPDDADDCFGGTARRLGYAAQQKARVAARNETMLLLDLGGSTFGGVLWNHSEYTLSMPGTLLFNTFPYDFCGFSPRDFITWTGELAKQQLVESYMMRNCPYLVSNGLFKGMWEPFNTKVERWIVKEMLNGWKVAFVALFPQQAEYGFSFGNSIMELNSMSLLTSVMSGRFELTLNHSHFVQQLESFSGQFNRLDPYYRDVFRLASLAPIDILVAAGEAKRAHPDVRATVLLVSGSQREDQVNWLAENGDFDIILRETEEPEVPQEITNVVSGKTALLAASVTPTGLGHLKVRIRLGKGVEQFNFRGDIPLGSSTPMNSTVQQQMSDLYREVREQNAGFWGRLTNPLVGGHRGAEPESSMNQCYYMDCNTGVYIGQALLWWPRASHGEDVADVSLYNLGGFRTPLAGDEQGRITLQNCKATLAFQNALNLYSVTGRDLYNLIKRLFVQEERGLMGAGWRLAYYEPCRTYVNYTGPWDVAGWTKVNDPPGKASEIANCRAAGVQDVQVKIINIQVKKNGEWTNLEKATVYKVATTPYMTSLAQGFQYEDTNFGTDAEALCRYIKHAQVLEVDSWEEFGRRGLNWYRTPEDGWSTGARMVSVEQDTSIIEEAPLCPAGKFLGANDRECQPCPSGKHSQVVQSSTEEESVICRECPSGFFANASEMSSCEACSAGKFSNTTGMSFCMGCTAGSFSDTGAHACSKCNRGQYADQAHSSVCNPCEVGKYQDQTGSTRCNECGLSLTTETIYSKSLEDCLCPPGMYWPPQAVPMGNATCQKCKVGLKCPMGSNMSRGNMSRVLLLAAYWSSASDPLNVFGCQSEAKCQGGLPPGENCKERLSGIACEVCEEGLYWNGDSCEACISNAGLFPLMPVLLAPAFVVLVYHKTKAPLANWDQWTGAVGLQGYILLNHFQILNLMRDAAKAMPLKVFRLLEFWGFSNDILSLFKPNCIGMASFSQRTWTNALLPLFFVIMSFSVMGSSWLLSSKFGRPSWRMGFDGIHNVIGHFLFTFFSGIVAQALSIFNCADNPNGKETMKADRSIICFESNEWNQVFLVGVISALLYFVLVVAAYFRAVLIAPCSGNFKDPNFQWRWKFLFVKFRADVYWFGIICLGKNSLINIGLLLFKSDAATLYWMMTVVVFYTALIIAYMPFRYRVANLLELCCCASLVYCCSFLVRWTEAGEDTDNAVSWVLRIMTFLPCVFSLPAIVFILRRKWNYSEVVEEAEIRDLFLQIKTCCGALVYLPNSVGEEMLQDVGEWDRHLFRRFILLVKAEVFGIGTYRLSSGTIANRYAALARDSQEKVAAAEMSKTPFRNLKTSLFSEYDKSQSIQPVESDKERDTAGQGQLLGPPDGQGAPKYVSPNSQDQTMRVQY